MKKKYALILWSAFVVCPVFAQVQWMASTKEMPWKTKESISLQKYDGTKEHLIEVFPSAKRQQIDGFGGCFNEKGMEIMSALPKAKRNEIMAQLFDQETGCAFNLCRVPMGSNDYSMDSYSYNDTPEDFEMKNFSIDRDRKYLIPYIKMAMNYNPALKIWGSPWCPPTWMKYSGYYGYQVNQDSSHIRWEPKVLKAYALYFKKYIQAYRNEGINLYAVHVQNEPYSNQIFPSCLWTGGEMRDFVRDYLGPELAGLDAEIWLGTINTSHYDLAAGAVLTDPEAAKYIKGIGFQWDGKNAIIETAAKHPSFKLMQTETECGGSENNMNSAIYTFGLMDHYFKAGVSSYMYWNMILDRSGLSTWGWAQNSMISIDRHTLQVSYNMEFYVMKHFAHFIKGGAYRLTTSGFDKNVLAFVNPDNEKILVVMNDSQFSNTYTIKMENKMFVVEIPGMSFNTFKIK